MKISLPDGRKIEATDVDFRTKKEDWNEYTLVDGSVLKFKTIVTSIIRTEDHDQTGKPVYLVRSTNVTRVKVSDKVRLTSTKEKKVDGMEVV